MADPSRWQPAWVHHAKPWARAALVIVGAAAVVLFLFYVLTGA